MLLKAGAFEKMVAGRRWKVRGHMLEKVQWVKLDGIDQFPNVGLRNVCMYHLWLNREEEVASQTLAACCTQREKGG